jgi:hypothetical protein
MSIADCSPPPPPFPLAWWPCRAQDTGERNVLVLGRVTSLERDHKPVQVAAAGGGAVAVKIEGNEEQQRIEVGRHFDTAQGVYSRVSGRVWARAGAYGC